MEKVTEKQKNDEKIYHSDIASASHGSHILCKGAECERYSPLG